MEQSSKKQDRGQDLEVMEEVVGILLLAIHSPNEGTIMVMNDTIYAFEGTVTPDIEQYIGEKVGVLRTESGYKFRHIET